MIKFTNKQLFFVLAFATYIAENMYFGWNRKPMSFAELWLDNLVVAMCVTGIFMKRLHVVIRVKRNAD